jgi:hypothetical protein
VEYKDYYILFGGKIVDFGDERPRNDVWLFDHLRQAGQQWQQMQSADASVACLPSLTPMQRPCAVFGHTATVVGHRMFVIGGAQYDVGGAQAQVGAITLASANYYLPRICDQTLTFCSFFSQLTRARSTSRRSGACGHLTCVPS